MHLFLINIHFDVPNFRRKILEETGLRYEKPIVMLQFLTESSKNFAFGFKRHNGANKIMSQSTANY
jgi:hypothetical protein